LGKEVGMVKARVTTVNKIRKRDGTVVAFDPRKIEDAIYKALVATRTGSRKLTSKLTLEVAARIKVAFSHGIPSVENVQDIVEEVLTAKGYHDVAKAYIPYREQQADIRRLKGIIGIRDDLKLTSTLSRCWSVATCSATSKANSSRSPVSCFTAPPIPSRRWKPSSARRKIYTVWKTGSST
jgi:non-canonical (house-cleaning) NTP pyrophosphatase